MAICNKCPRGCKLNNGVGLCGVSGIKVAKIMPHYFEEPVISGTKGSGAIFFSGCNLRCCFCQNRPISHGVKGEDYTIERLAEEIFALSKSGVHNINLVTAAHIVPEIVKVLKLVKPYLAVPVVYNSSGYEGDISCLEGLVDVYLPDFKYYDSGIAAKYSLAPDYPIVAKRTIKEMIRQVGEVKIEDGLIKKGVIIRHLVLPSCRKDSIKIMEYIGANFSDAYVSIMSQFTPQFNEGYSELSRKVTSFEYNSVVDVAVKLGLNGFMQDVSSADTAFTPEF